MATIDSSLISGRDADGMPFATQFFNDEDDYGGGGFDDDAGGEGLPAGLDEDAELLAATQGQVRRVRPEFVQYAKKVKRVDVRKLKENIWKGLDIVLPKGEDEVGTSSITYSTITDVFYRTLTPRPRENRQIHEKPRGLSRSFQVSEKYIRKRRWMRLAPPSASSACSILPTNVDSKLKARMTES